MLKNMETIKKLEIEWNVHHANDIDTNPIDFLYCFEGGSTRESSIRVYKVEFQHPVGENGCSLNSDDIFKAEFFILYTLHFNKICEDYDPYGEEWYMNYTSIDMIAWDYSTAHVFKSFEELEHRIMKRTDVLAYFLSHITDSPEEAIEAAGKTGIISVSSHKERYNGYENYALRPNTPIEDITWYFNEFHTSIGILSTKIENDRIYFNLDRDGKSVFRLENNRGYLEHWREHRWEHKEDTLCTFATRRAFDAVKWLLFMANHELPLREYP